MKRILVPILLLTLLFSTLAQGQSLNDWVGKGKGLLCETTGVGCPESVDEKDLVIRDGLYYKKFTDVPFTGKVKGVSFKNGKSLVCGTTGVGCLPSVDIKNLVQRDGLYYKKNTEVPFTGKTTGVEQGLVKSGKMHGLWMRYRQNGQLDFKLTYKDGKLDGLTVRYNKNGQLRSKETYKNDKRHGPSVYYSSTGELYSKGAWKDGMKAGRSLGPLLQKPAS